MNKQYPLYEYVNFEGKSIKFAYKYTEDDMYNDRFNNGLYHYTYFEDMCKKFIKEKYGLFNTFGRERTGPITVSGLEIFFHNLFTLNRNDKIHIIKPMKYRYNADAITKNQLLSDRYKTVVVVKGDSLDMISMKYTGTRAYTELIARANGMPRDIPQNYTIKPGTVLRIPTDLTGSSENDDSIHEMYMSRTRIIKIANSNDLNKLNLSALVEEGTIFVCESPKPTSCFIYYDGKLIRLMN